jgi:hypothetical protein
MRLVIRAIACSRDTCRNSQHLHPHQQARRHLCPWKYRLSDTLKVAYSNRSRPAQSIEIASPAIMQVCIPVPSRIPHAAAR